MRPSARISALIELLWQVEEGIATSGAPADVIVNKYFRERRYAGSKDRRTISSYLYAILRNREALLSCLEGVGVSPRSIALAYFGLHEAEALELFGEEGNFAPSALMDEELEFLKSLPAISLAERAIANVPKWAVSGFETRFGTEWVEAAKALNEPASLDMRINPLKTKLGLDEKIKKSIEDVNNTEFSPIGYRSIANVNLSGLGIYKSGELEVQDEAAQLASLLVDAKPGTQVADLCAGAGGKSLLVSACMENRGQLYAFDISAKRLSECKKRSQRAGVRNIQVSRLDVDTDKRASQLSSLKACCDRVFVDVPCSGTGTWRRSPDQRWRQGADSLKTLNELQLALLSEGASLVRAGGRLLYMTCSVLPQENEAVVEEFLSRNSDDWSILDYRSVWEEAIGNNVPDTCAMNENMLQLAPHAHRTDGFFVAILERK